jgi:hypothetical protein
MNYKFKFKEENSNIELRKKDCDKIRKDYSNKIPIICEKDSNKPNLQEIDKSKFLVPDDLQVSQFSSMIRQRINIDNKKAIYLLFAGQYSVTMDATMSEVYEKFKDPEDGFLYVVYSCEETWG